MSGQIVIMPGERGGYEDGDVMCAWRRETIRYKWAEILSRRGDPNTLLEYFLQKTSKYKCEVISNGTELKRTDQETSDVTILSEVENIQGEVVYVQQFMAMYNSANMPLFDNTFYCGNILDSNVILDDVWAYIEANTSYEEVNYPWYPWDEYRRFLVLSIQDFTLSEQRNYVEPLMDNGTVVKKKKCYVSWRAGTTVLGITEADVLDRFKDIRVLHVQLLKSIIQEKS